jgi:outer membrane receptor protein involved in Fe transport
MRSNKKNREESKVQIMLSQKLLASISFSALVFACDAHAQESSNDGEFRQQTVVVTGSAIMGTPEDAALPVDVITAGDLKLEGNPSLTELIQQLGVSSGVDGQSNQFASNGLEGTANINLRGLGPGRTLVLLNGRRQVFSPYAIGEQAQLFVDTNSLPRAAIGRVEVLKDGAAAIYGSDAIAGVVNFITRRDVDGLELAGEYQTYEGTDGEYNLSGVYGVQFEGGASWITSIGYNFRNEVPLIEKDWFSVPYAENPVAGWSSIGNPGAFVAAPNISTGLAAAGTPLAFAQPDALCNEFGNVATGPVCRFQFTPYDNLVEEEERYQIFSEYNRSFGDTELHIEGLYSFTDVPEWKTSPSYPPQALFGQFVAPDHPGLQQYISDNPAWADALYTDYSPLLGGGNPLPGALNPAATPLLYFGRSFGAGGFPLSDGPATGGYRQLETMRIAGSINGQFDNGVFWDAGLSWARAEGERRTPDTYIVGLDNALNGFGVCTDPAGRVGSSLTAGEGDCEYYNPFSNALSVSTTSGFSNPQFNPSLANSDALADYLTTLNGADVTSELAVFDLVFSGDSPLSAPGGNVGWAFGLQVRKEDYEIDPNDVSDLTLFPCPFAGEQPGNDGLCDSPNGRVAPTGPLAFLAGQLPFENDQTIYAAFAEFQIPLYENVDIQLAMRYEDYGGDVGSTFDPKIAAKWQVSESLSLRGSAQTSFRGPTLNQLGGQGTTLQFVAATGAFKAVDTFGNPDLNPESAFSYNAGALFERGGFRGSVDFYSIDFSDPIIVESQDDIVANFVQSQLFFQDPSNPSVGTITRIVTNIVNGPDVETSGLDLRAEYDLQTSLLNGQLSFGADATYILTYDVGVYEIDGVSIVGGDFLDQFNRSNPFRSLPQWKGNLFANYAIGDHNLRAVVRHIDSYDDERGTPDLSGAFQASMPAEIDSQTTLDFYYNVELPWRTSLSMSVVNVTDEDPPSAFFDTNYDPYTHNPFGRTFKVSVTKAF